MAADRMRFFHSYSLKRSSFLQVYQHARQIGTDFLIAHHPEGRTHTENNREASPSNKKPLTLKRSGVGIRCLAVSYSHMGKPHTTIGAEHFHFRVRNGIGWFLLAMAARRNC
jgi:hypothetical protein